MRRLRALRGRRAEARLRRQEHGAIAIETALSYMLVMTCVLGVIECCVMTYTYSVYADAVRQGVRYAIFHGADSSTCSGPSSGCSDSTGANVSSAVTNYAQMFTAPVSSPQVTVTYPDGSSAASSRVIVTVAYTYKPLFKFPGSNVAFHVTSQGRIVY